MYFDIITHAPIYSLETLCACTCTCTCMCIFSLVYSVYDCVVHTCSCVDIATVHLQSCRIILYGLLVDYRRNIVWQGFVDTCT